MRPTRSARRLFTTFFVVVSVLFAQLALAQFICPLDEARAPQAAAMEMPEGMTCDGMSHEQDAQPALCHHHCTNPAQSFEPLKVPTVSLPAIVQVLVVPLRMDAAREQALVFALAGTAQPPPSPVFLTTLRLRV
jgi:hypothetical protein